VSRDFHLLCVVLRRHCTTALNNIRTKHCRQERELMDRGEWSASHSGRLIPQYVASVGQWMSPNPVQSFYHVPEHDTCHRTAGGRGLASLYSAMPRHHYGHLHFMVSSSISVSLQTAVPRCVNVTPAGSKRGTNCLCWYWWRRADETNLQTRD
jgi:hypothetical protein